MKQPKRPAPAKAAAPSIDQDEASIRHLLSLALDLSSLDDYATVPDELAKKLLELRRTIRKSLHQKKEAVLAEALERALEEDAAAAVLRENLEEASGTVVFRRDQDADIEVNAFVIPLIVHSTGGLRENETFQDEQAFEQLRASIQEGGLESRDASVVLVSHAYHRDEMERIGYVLLNEMVQEAFDAMTRKKATAAPAIMRSIHGWPAAQFAPDDIAVELRFLLGFALKKVNDPFYQVPQKEAAADRYFAARAQRFQDWTRQAAPLLQRCLASAGRAIDIDFLYQDLFHGGMTTGLSEYALLQMMAELRQALDAHGAAPETASAIVGPLEIEDEAVLRVHLHAGSDGALLATADKPVAPGRALSDETDDVCDALATLGIGTLALASRFDADGEPVDVRRLPSY